jgi:hypothetical protein
MDVRLQELTIAAAAMGRAAVLIAVNDAYYPGDDLVVGDTQRWDRTGDLLLAHLGNTEGDVEFASDPAFSEMAFPELTGPMAHRRLYDGESLVVTLPLFFADPDLRAIASPTGSASGGYGRQRPVREHTLVIVPEQLLYDPTADAFEALTYSQANGFRVGGSALTDEQERLLGLSVWIWRGSFGRNLPAYSHADGGKTIVPVEFTAMYAEEFPDGHRLYTLGDPTVAGIDLDQ